MGDLIEISDYRSEERIQNSDVVLTERDWDDPAAPWNRNLSFQVGYRIRRFLAFLFSLFKYRKKS